MNQHSTQPTISAIIPALNEAGNIARVIAPLIASGVCKEIIVVDDGSTDGTAAIAREAGARVIEQHHQGKGGAMRTGAQAAEGDILCFFDADITQMTPDIVQCLVAPVRDGLATMVIGLRDKPFFERFLNRFAPVLGGERVIRRSTFFTMLSLGGSTSNNFGIETWMNGYCAKKKLPVEYIFMPGVRHVIKEKKYGLAKGFIARIKMIGQILKAEIEIMKMQ
ncbi:glycosyltransferase family 2 protein [Candidatus Uhrbacteria bacterium]|nr:glycosyltransferase family 2 protein [Candidatus Uhrbacteria bacterium]